MLQHSPLATLSPASEKVNAWAIVGGGFLGMTLAYRLAQGGCRVTLIEGAGELGGLAGIWQLGDLLWDRHYHVTLLSDHYNRGLLRDLGIEQEMDWVETRTGMYANGKLYSVSNAIEYLRLPVLGLTDKSRLAATILYASRVRNWKKLESIPVTTWLGQLSGRRTFERFWVPLLRAKLGENYHDVSAAFIWATIRRLYAARHTGLKKELFGTMRGGYRRTIGRFHDALLREGVKVMLDRRVRSVEKIAHGLELTYADGSSEKFEKVIVTTNCSQAERLCPGLSLRERDLLRGVRYMGIVCASLLLSKPLADFYLTYLMDDWVPFTAVVEMSNLVDPHWLGGRSLVYLPKYVAPDDSLFRAGDEEIQERFVSALERMYPHFCRKDLLAFRISRVREVFAIPTLNYSQSLPPVATTVPGLYLVNSAHIVNATLNVNETVQLAESFAAMLLGDLRRATLLTP